MEFSGQRKIESLSGGVVTVEGNEPISGGPSFLRGIRNPKAESGYLVIASIVYVDDPLR
jgi:hypothetical protein